MMVKLQLVDPFTAIVAGALTLAPAQRSLSTPRHLLHL